MKPIKDPLGVGPSKGNQGTTRGKEKIILTSVGIEPTTSRIRSAVTLPTAELRGRTEKVGDESIRSEEGLTLETSASESLYGGQLTLSTQLIKPDYLVKNERVVKTYICPSILP